MLWIKHNICIYILWLKTLISELVTKKKNRLKKTSKKNRDFGIYKQAKYGLHILRNWIKVLF